ncbi:hypothetical protein O181_109570 [Austropuccinia psidii MF-1]|uniref:Uncharacterized protein n=1 Tax=Austropuccinia psidii MF-1 TaxID=1389203 RepID=A0A9Q3PQP3_9BASI|nr:hypothetical protein [Austropuccinia psidii MF-1]
MTPTRSGSNFSIQSYGTGPGHSSHKSKIQECQPRGEAQMEVSINSTGSQRLARTFDTLLESPEADCHNAVCQTSAKGTLAKKAIKPVERTINTGKLYITFHHVTVPPGLKHCVPKFM